MLSYLAIDDLVIHDLDDTSPVTWLERVEGFDEPTFRIAASEKSGEDGGYVANALLGMRTVGLRGVVRGDSYSQYASARHDLQRACSITRNSAGRPIAKRITLRTLDGTEHFVDGHVRQLLIGPSDHNDWSDFLIQLLCPDPQIFLTNQSIAGPINRPTSGGVHYPVSYPLTYGSSEGGLVVLNNLGTTDTWPVFTLSGGLTNPSLRVMGTSKRFELSTTMTASDEIVIDMKEKTVVKNNATNFLNVKSNDSEWFSLPPGSTTIRFTTTNSGDEGTLTAAFYHALLSI